MKISELLKAKSRPVITIGPDETVYEGIKKLVENNIGALPVCDNVGNMLGIISERDLLKEICKVGESFLKTSIIKVMTRDVVVGILDDNLEYIMSVMTKRRIRHLPIMDGGRLVSMISSRDIMEVQLEECRVEVRLLSDYITSG